MTVGKTTLLEEVSPPLDDDIEDGLVEDSPISIHSVSCKVEAASS